MHIVYITGEYPSLNPKHGGVGTFIKSLSIQFVAHEIEVSVVGIYNLQENVIISEEGIQVYGIKASHWRIGKFFQNSRRLTETLETIHQKSPIDIVEGAELSFAFLPKNTPYKKVIRMHGGHHFFAVTLGRKPALWRSYQEKKSFEKADKLLAVSDYVGSKTTELLHLKKDYTVIYNPVNMQLFKKVDKSKAIPNTLLFVGTVCEKKGVRQLIQAMPLVLEKIPNAKLNIVGRDWMYPDGKSYIEEMQSLISDKIRNNIHFIGVVLHKELPQWMEKAEICVYPSHMEAMPIAWLEALGMGKPVVASDIPPGHEAIENGITGLLANPKEPKEIAEKIIWMLQNKELATQMGEKASEIVLEKFNLEKLVIENKNYYQSIL